MTPALLLLTHLAGTVVGVVLTLAWLVRRHRRTRAAQVVALLERMAANPIQPACAPCGVCIGLTSDGWWELQFAEIAHVQVCAACQREVERA